MNSEQSSYFSLPSSRIIGMCHHTEPFSFRKTLFLSWLLIPDHPSSTIFVDKHCHILFLQCWGLNQDCLHTLCAFTQLKATSPASCYSSKNLFVSGKWCSHFTDVDTGTLSFLGKQMAYCEHRLRHCLTKKQPLWVRIHVFWLGPGKGMRSLTADPPDLVLQFVIWSLFDSLPLPRPPPPKFWAGAVHCTFLVVSGAHRWLIALCPRAVVNWYYLVS